MRRGRSYTLQVTLTMPALGGGASNSPHGSKTPVNTTDYALLVTAPAGGAANAAYKRAGVRPALKPALLKKPQVQSNGNLLWARVPMPRYQGKAFTRTFKVGGGEGRD